MKESHAWVNNAHTIMTQVTVNALVQVIGYPQSVGISLLSFYFPPALHLNCFLRAFLRISSRNASGLVICVGILGLSLVPPDSQHGNLPHWRQWTMVHAVATDSISQRMLRT